MQTIAAYLLERSERADLSLAHADTSSAFCECQEVCLDWLVQKGGDRNLTSGPYEAPDGSDATFVIEEAEDGDDALWMLSLLETTAEGRQTRTTASITSAEGAVVVYVTIQVGFTDHRITTIPARMKCPRVVRMLLGSLDGWTHGGYPIRGLTRVIGFDMGLGFAEELLRTDRGLPVVVVSLLPNGMPPIGKLPEALEFDLAGIANVVTLDVDSTWAVTDVLGPKLSCFDGGVRVYWPNLQIAGEYRRHPLWTRARLVQNARDDREASVRIRKHLRRVVMRASALSVTRPAAVDRIRGAQRQRMIAERIASARTPGDFEALANDYAKENDGLRDHVAELEQMLRESETRELKLEEKVHDLEQRIEDLESASGSTGDEGEASSGRSASPKSGEVRFYKKRYSTPGYDVLVEVKDCGHNNWESAHKADKARKGVVRHEGGRDDWKKMEHCATCKGGGLWRVEW